MEPAVVTALLALVACIAVGIGVLWYGFRWVHNEENNSEGE
jgi:TRAP-type C4-dicarboxylate transport system permease small subunit